MPRCCSSTPWASPASPPPATRPPPDRHPTEVIALLRSFHHAWKPRSSRHHGTLGKHPGDGLMATFGTPVAGPRDAARALACARAMIAGTETWNPERARAGEDPIRPSVGVHFGPVVPGDIGANRLEYAVICNTVNVANRLDSLSRPLEASLVVSDHLPDAVLKTEGVPEALTAGLKPRGAQAIRGLDRAVEVRAA